MKKTKYIIYVLIALSVLGGLYCVRTLQNQEKLLGSQKKISEYLKTNISTLSSKKEVLGGRFYITDVKVFDDKNGYVDYEDGHVSYRAKFSYSVKNGQVSIDSFVLFDEN